MAGQEDNWQCRTKCREPVLQVRTAQSRQLDVEQNAAQFAAIGQLIQKLLSVLVAYDVVPLMAQQSR